MPRAKRGSEEWRANVSEGTKRAGQPWKNGVKLLPRHVARYARSGKVAPGLRPALAAAVRDAGAYAESLGGRAVLSEGELLMLEALVRAKTVINAMFERYAKTGDPAALEGASPWLLAEARALNALGLRRRPRSVPDLATYLRQHDAKAEAPTLDVAPVDGSQPTRKETP